MAEVDPVHSSRSAGWGPISETLSPAFIFLSYIGVALLQTWPLPLHLSTHLTGILGGDTGAYVWNTWVFRHELIELHRWPFSTLSVLALDGPVSLGLHNYTVFANLLALPLQSWLGVVASFNVVYLINVALSGFGMFLLARRVTGRVGESWIAGAIFAWAPFLVARGTSHFSLAAAAPLPFFVYWLDRALDTARVRDAVAAGLTLAWAGFCDPYYAIYCVMIGAAVIVGRAIVVESSTAPSGRRRARLLIDIAIGTLASVIVGVYGLAGGVLTVGTVSIAMRTLYTPMLALTLLVLIRLLLTIRWTVRSRPVPRRVFRTIAVIAISGAILLAPELYAIVLLASEGGLVTAPVLWRSSAPGVDALSFLLPNPHHPLAPAVIVDWLARQPGQFDENVMSLSLVGLGVVVAAWRWAGFRPRPLWVVITLGFASLALGPFLRVGGLYTFIPTPWALLRYAPIIGEARMPQRFGIVVFLGFTVIVAGALVALGRRYPARRGFLLAAVGVALAVELLPAPRTLYSTGIPAVYRVIAADPRPVRVLELPFGIRDGLSSFGDYSAASQFYQTMHHKQLIGGYLSRVEERTKMSYRRHPTVRTLMDLSEGGVPGDRQLQEARSAATSLMTDGRVGYVVIDTVRASPALQRFAADSFGLTRLDADGAIELYTPRGSR